MSKILLTEYRMKPMFRDDFNIAWRKLYIKLKKDGHVGRTELYKDEESKFYSMVEWKTNRIELHDSPYAADYSAILEIIDKIHILSPLTQVEENL